MEQYIKKSALVAEIKKRAIEAGLHDGVIAETREDECYSILSLIDNLEVKEVDLDKEIDLVEDKYRGFESLSRADIIEIAKHFFEFGLKAKDWKNERMKECPFRQNICNRYKGTQVKCDGRCSWVVDYPKLKEFKEQKGE